MMLRYLIRFSVAFSLLAVFPGMLAPDARAEGNRMPSDLSVPDIHASADIACSANRIETRPFHASSLLVPGVTPTFGGIMIANTAEMDIRPGAMGKPLPGIAAGIVSREGETVTELPDGAIGELALRPGWPSMMRAYLGQPERYARAFAGGWYLTGDLAMRDADGYYWFVGRADDLIKSSGHLIGPFEVESALIEHPAVAEAAVIGIPEGDLSTLAGDTADAGAGQDRGQGSPKGEFLS